VFTFLSEALIKGSTNMCLSVLFGQYENPQQSPYYIAKQYDPWETYFEFQDYPFSSSHTGMSISKGASSLWSSSVRYKPISSDLMGLHMNTTYLSTQKLGFGLDISSYNEIVDQSSHTMWLVKPQFIYLFELGISNYFSGYLSPVILRGQSVSLGLSLGVTRTWYAYPWHVEWEVGGTLMRQLGFVQGRLEGGYHWNRWSFNLGYEGLSTPSTMIHSPYVGVSYWF